MITQRLIESEIADFFAGFGSPGEPQTPEEMQHQLLGRIATVFASQSPKHWTELVTPACLPCPSDRELMGECNWLDWNQLSALGLMFRINHEILHPMGLAIFRESELAISKGALVAPDGVFTYPEYMVEETYKGAV
ncbi:hypothetical protein PUG81_25750 [Erwiniaceae bacterium L1_54_6]|nr:hypothetical protein [Erwiniaceae bacterium L1_54_6]